ncbi:MAG: rmd [Acidobacteria bacterium]|nr:rmd [Acidobacteriota bacterium]
MKVLISGAGGFCGRHMLRYALTKGADVHTIGPRRTSANHHFAALFDEEAVTSTVRDVAPDAILHLAGVSSSNDVAMYYRVNTAAAAVLFRSLGRAGHRCPVLVVGTSAEYGVPSAADLPLTEAFVGRPYNHYGISKFAQSLMAQRVAADGYPVVVARPFNILGPGMPEHGAVQSFARQIADIENGRCEPVIRVGNLKPSRDFIHVDDVVRIYWNLLGQPAAYGQVVNVCTGVETTLADILAALVAAADVCVRIEVDPVLVKTVDIDHHYGSTAKLHALLNEVAQPPTTAQIVQILEHLRQEP